MTLLLETGNGVLDTALDRIRPLFKVKHLEDIVVNRAREVILYTRGGRTIRTDKYLDLEYWLNLARVLANDAGLPWNGDTPRVSVQLPGGHRLEFLAGRCVKTGLSVAIRVKSGRRFQARDFGVTPDQEATLRALVADGGNIIISGGTGTGKTSFANWALTAVPLDDRVCIAEDVPELTVDNPNQQGFVVGRHGGTMSYDDVFDHLMRARPDRVLLGELSIPNAFPCLNFLNTGHRGFLTTIHANSPREVLDVSIWMRCGWAGHNVDRTVVTEFLERNVGAIVQISNHGGKRHVSEIYYPEPRR